MTRRAAVRPVPSSPYTAGFYDTIRPGVQSSASVLVPLVVEAVNPRTVVDVGCGEGWWAHAFAECCGCEVLGIDGAYVPSSPLGDRFVAHDLTQPLPPHIGPVDLAVCLEVAEHLPADRAESFVADLCALSDAVLFSAAVPGQGGAGHVNERELGYWVGLFRQLGYGVSGALRWRVWDDPRVENWYQANSIIAARHPDRYPDLFDTPLATPWPVVHPVLFDARRAR